MTDIFASPIDSSRLQPRDHASVDVFAAALPEVVQADPDGSVTVGDLSRALNKRLNRRKLPGIPTSTVRRLIRATGFRTRNLEEDVLVQGIRLAR